MNLADPRIPYGMNCTWWGRIYDTKPKRIRVSELPSEHRAMFQMRADSELTIPSCPHCGGLLSEAPSLAEWYKGVDDYAAKNNVPGYRELVDFLRECGRCWPLDGDPPGYEDATREFLAKRWARTPPPERLKCEGYFGFGGGYELKRYGARESYCNGCALGPACWQKHRDRVRGIVPELAAEADKLSEEMQGPDYVEAFTARFGGPPPDVTVMLGNVEDGMAVAVGAKPKDRGPGTLPWPFPGAQPDPR